MRQLWLVLLALLVAAGMAFAGGDGEEGAAAPAGDAEPEFQIGIVFDVGGRGDKSFNDSAYRGLVRLAEEYNGYIADDPDNVDFGTEIELKYLEPKQGGGDRELLLRTLAEDGFDLLYGVGFAFTDALGKVAADFPDTHFVLIDGFIEGLDESSNITCVAFAEHEGSFLVGALAGLFVADESPDSPVGFVGGMDIPLIHKFHGGFLAGAMWTNENLRVEQMLMGQYIGSDPTAFQNPTVGESIATNMYNRGAFVVYHASGASGAGVFNAALQAGKWAIGVDSDQGLVYATSDNAQERRIGEHILTSMLKRVDNSVFLSAEDFMTDGNLAGGYATFDLSDGGVDYAVNEYNRDLIAPYTDELEEIKQMIIDGEITVPQHDNEVRDWAMSVF